MRVTLYVKTRWMDLKKEPDAINFKSGFTRFFYIKFEYPTSLTSLTFLTFKAWLKRQKCARCRRCWICEHNVNKKVTRTVHEQAKAVTVTVTL